MAKQSRRPVGAVTVFKRMRRGREVWVGELTVGYDELTGKRRVRTFYGTKRREVAERLGEATAQQSKGVDLLQGKQTVADYLEDWFEATAEEKGWRPRTRVDYRALLDRHILPQLGHLALSDLHPSRVLRPWLNELARPDAKGKPRVGARARGQARGLLSTALQQAVAEGTLAVNPVSAVRGPSRPKRKAQALPPETVMKLLAKVEGHPYEGVFVLAVLTGMRWGEIAGLTWGNVDLAAREVHVRQALVEITRSKSAAKLGIDTRRTLGAVKTIAGQRTIPLPQRAVEALRRHHAAVGATPIGSVLAFRDAAGGPLCRSNFHKRHWKPLRDALGLPKDYRPHDLRHCYASALLRAGTDVVTVSHLMGHESPEITLRIYSHMMPGAETEAAGRLDSLYGS